MMFGSGQRTWLRRRAVLVLATLVSQGIRAATVTEDTAGPVGVEVLITTLAGDPGQRGYLDGVGTNARFHLPQVLSSRFALAFSRRGQGPEREGHADATFAGGQAPEARGVRRIPAFWPRTDGRLRPDFGAC